MTNPIIIFWQWINPRSKKGKRRDYSSIKGWAAKNAENLIKLSLILSFLVPTIVFYKKSYDVPVIRTELTCSSLNPWRFGGGNDRANIEIDICHNYGRNDTIPQYKDRKISTPGTHVRLYGGKNGKDFSDKNSWSIRERINNAKRKKQRMIHNDSLMMPLFDLIESSNIGKTLNFYSICHAFKIEFLTDIVPSFIPRRTIVRNTPEYVTDGNRMIAQFAVQDSLYISSREIYQRAYWLTSNIGYPQHTFNFIGNAFSQQGGMSFFKAKDISRAVETIHINGNVRLKRLRYYFNGPIEISKMNPKPDYEDVNSIEFTDSAKLADISYYGLTFHAKFPDMENIQQARTFALTTLITLLLTIMLKVLYDLTIDLWIWMSVKHKRLFCLLLAVVVLLPIVYTILTLYIS